MTVPLPVVATVSVNTWVNTAPTFSKPWSSVSEHDGDGLEPAQPPDQLVKTQPASGVAVSEIGVWLKAWVCVVQPVPQLMPAGFDVIRAGAGLADRHPRRADAGGRHRRGGHGHGVADGDVRWLGADGVGVEANLDVAGHVGAEGAAVAPIDGQRVAGGATASDGDVERAGGSAAAVADTNSWVVEVAPVAISREPKSSGAPPAGISTMRFPR